jgi:hypothetical protein
MKRLMRMQSADARLERSTGDGQNPIAGSQRQASVHGLTEPARGAACGAESQAS